MNFMNYKEEKFHKTKLKAATIPSFHSSKNRQGN